MNMDDNRFKAIYEEYYQHLFHFCLSYVHQKEEAEDIVQDVFFNLYVKPCKDENIKAWLFTCVANRAKNYLKRKKNSIKIYQEYYLRSKNAESNEERNYDLFKIIDRMPTIELKIIHRICEDA